MMSRLDVSTPGNFDVMPCGKDVAQQEICKGNKSTCLRLKASYCEPLSFIGYYFVMSIEAQFMNAT